MSPAAFCTGCGHPVDPAAAFCDQCGAAQQLEVPEAAGTWSADATPALAPAAAVPAAAVAVAEPPVFAPAAMPSAHAPLDVTERWEAPPRATISRLPATPAPVAGAPRRGRRLGLIATGTLAALGIAGGGAAVLLLAPGPGPKRASHHHAARALTAARPAPAAASGTAGSAAATGTSATTSAGPSAGSAATTAAGTPAGSAATASTPAASPTPASPGAAAQPATVPANATLPDAPQGSPPPPAAAVASVAGDPLSALQDYWSDISAGDFGSAFGFLAPGSGLTRAQFVSAERQAGVQEASFSGHVVSSGPGRATVQVISLSTMDSQFGCRQWNGTYRMTDDAGRWLIQRAVISPTPCGA